MNCAGWHLAATGRACEGRCISVLNLRARVGGQQCHAHCNWLAARLRSFWSIQYRLPGMPPFTHLQGSIHPWQRVIMDTVWDSRPVQAVSSPHYHPRSAACHLCCMPPNPDGTDLEVGRVGVAQVQGTANLVEVAKRAGVERIVLVSSIGADEPFFPLNLLFGVRPCLCLLLLHRHMQHPPEGLLLC